MKNLGRTIVLMLVVHTGVLFFTAFAKKPVELGDSATDTISERNPISSKESARDQFYREYVESGNQSLDGELEFTTGPFGVQVAGENQDTNEKSTETVKFLGFELTTACLGAKNQRTQTIVATGLGVRRKISWSGYGTNPEAATSQADSSRSTQSR